jgi:hypothetical protein
MRSPVFRGRPGRSQFAATPISATIRSGIAVSPDYTLPKVSIHPNLHRLAAEIVTTHQAPVMPLSPDGRAAHFRHDN